MPTDHAVMYSQRVMASKEAVRTVDEPDFMLGKGESVSVPMRYVVDNEGVPVLADGMMDLLRKQNDTPFDFDN
jgi:ribosome biogenesis SPOUT family RNA methylase Rps3